MSTSRRTWLTAFWLFMIGSTIVLGTTPSNEGDFAFDTVDDPQAEIVSQKSSEECPVRRLWGVPDMPAYVGRAFKLQIPAEAFSGKIVSYKASGQHGPLPQWLVFDKHKGLLKGVPDAKDHGDYRLVITAVPFVNDSAKCPAATDGFTIEVKDKKEIPSHGTDMSEQCHSGEEEMQMKIIIDRPVDLLSPKQKLLAITNLANFMAIDYRSLFIQTHEPWSESNGRRINVVHSGGGDRKKKNSKPTTEIQFTVGCSGKLWKKHSILVHQMRTQAKDGTISNLLHLPMVGWQVVSYKHPVLTRKERDIEGSAYPYDEDDENIDYDEGSGLEGDYEENEEVETGHSFLPIPEPPTARPETHHPHRHHHGEVPQPYIPKRGKFQSTTAEPIEIVPSTVTFATTAAIEETRPETEPVVPPGPTPSPHVTLPEETPPAPETTTAVYPPRVETETDPQFPPETPPWSRVPPPATTPTTAAVATTASPSDEVSTFETPVTLLVSPATPQIEDTATTLIATTVNANVVQEREEYPVVETPLSEHNITLVEETSSDSPVEEDVAPKRFNFSLTFEPTNFNPPNSSSSSAPKGRILDFGDIPLHEIITSPAFEEKVSSLWPDFDFNNTIFGSTKEPTTEPQPTTKESVVVEMTSTERSSTIEGRTTETVEFTIPMNQPPQIQHRMRKVSVTAGKAFSYIIPEDLFIDTEDGTNLRLAMYNLDRTPLSLDSWVQFNAADREVYGLPLEDHVSKWEYMIEATDSQGATVHDVLDIIVQHHKSRRTVNHEVSMKFRLNKKYAATVDWQIRVLKGLVNLFRDTDMDQITVRNVVTTSDPIEFIWTNDTLPKQDCPKADIDRLMGILQSSTDGDPSPALISAMGHELIMKSVTWQGFGSCQGPPSTVLPQLPNHSDNFSPMPRNQIDIIKANVGELLIFKVPEDTFYDHEDGNARQLKLRLTKGDRSDIHPYNWLQFDSKNQEFYGLPLERDKGRKDYQLVCEDSGGLTASDGLIVEVKQGPQFNPTLEMKMTIDTPYEKIAQSALLKRKLIESLQVLFDDKNPNSIRIKSITQGTHTNTVVSWYNTTLATNRCPDEEIQQLRNVMTSNKVLTDKVYLVMGNEFPVVSVSFAPLGVCAVGVVAPPPNIPPLVVDVPSEETSKTMKSDDYIVTFIVPIVVIVCMILIAALIACILYRRRRSGKMSVGDDEERQAFRSKGIPVIFQDELDEKPDASNKTPIIMKEEKPPLLPPPEYKGGDSNSPTPSHTPYHPPPPFTATRDNARNNRPKPTPAYRKPPPYVPP